MKRFIKNACLTVTILFFCSLSVCLAQDDLNKLMLKKGKLIVQINAGTAVGQIQTIKYRLEQVKLSKPYDLHDDKPPLENVFRLVVVTDKPLPTGFYSIWLDDRQIDAYTIKPNAIAIIIYERTLPDSMIKLSISQRQERKPELRTVLTGTLSVPSEYAVPLEEIQANQPIIKLRRLAGRFPRVEIRIENVRGCAVTGGSIPLLLEIDGYDFNLGCDRDTLIISRLTIQDFAELRDGAEIAVKFATGSIDTNQRRVLGRLNKNVLE